MTRYSFKVGSGRPVGGHVASREVQKALYITLNSSPPCKWHLSAGKRAERWTPACRNRCARELDPLEGSRPGGLASGLIEITRSNPFAGAFLPVWCQPLHPPHHGDTPAITPVQGSLLAAKHHCRVIDDSHAPAVLWCRLSKVRLCSVFRAEVDIPIRVPFLLRSSFESYHYLPARPWGAAADPGSSASPIGLGYCYGPGCHVGAEEAEYYPTWALQAPFPVVGWVRCLNPGGRASRKCLQGGVIR